MRRRLGAGHRRHVAVIAEGHDVFLLVFLPLEEGLVGGVDVETRVIGLVDQFLGVGPLVADAGVIVLERVLFVFASLDVGEQRCLVRRHLDAAHDDVAHVPGLGVEHVEGIPLVLHAEVEQLRVVAPDHALVEVGGGQAVGRPQPQVLGHEREVVQVAGAQDDRVDLGGGAVLEGRGILFDLLQQRHFLPVIRPLVAHRRGAVRYRDRLAAVFPALRADVLGRVRGADDQDILVLEFHRVAEIVRVQHAAVEGFETLEVGHVRRREVAGRNHDVIEFLAVFVILLFVVCGDCEHSRGFVVGDVTHRRIEANPRAHAGLLDATLDVIVQHRARRIGCDRLAEVVLEKIVGELEAFLGSVGPEVTIHAAVDRLAAVLVETGSPGVAPQAAPVLLLLEADDVRNLGALLLGRLKCPELRQAARTGAYHCYTL